MTKVKGDLAFANTKEQASLTRARMAEKEASTQKKLYETSQQEYVSYKINAESEGAKMKEVISRKESEIAEWKAKLEESERARREMAEEIKEIKERLQVGSLIPYGQRIIKAVNNNERKVIRKFPIVESFTTVEFIV